MSLQKKLDKFGVKGTAAKMAERLGITPQKATRIITTRAAAQGIPLPPMQKPTPRVRSTDTGYRPKRGV